MTVSSPSTLDQAPSRRERFGFLDAMRTRLAGCGLRVGSLGRQARRMCVWLEEQAFPALVAAGGSPARLEIDRDTVRLLGRQVAAEVEELRGVGRVCRFLRQLGIEQLELDPRLESNQVLDVLTLLCGQRRRLPWGGDPRRAGGLAARLSGDGVHVSCTHTRIVGNALVIEYSYCQTRLSGVVQWFVRRQRHFQDHRALFRAARWYALLPVVTTLGTFVLFALGTGWWVLLAATLLGAAALWAMVYLFFMTVGSVEYDSEERAYRLQQAYTQLRRYAHRIREDLSDAREVQRQLLPDLKNMPLPGRLEWAASFCPETEVGGDYFDAALLDGDKVAVLFADVSGHGTAAALITVVLKTRFQAWTDGGWELEAFAREANRDLCRLTPVGSFAVLVAGVYDPATREFRYVNCGHSPEPIHIPADPAEPVAGLTDGHAMLLGVEEEVALTVARRRLSPGDTVLLVTDGLTEAMDVDGEMYGRTRLDEAVEAHRAERPEALVRLLLEDVGRFVGSGDQTDDRTVLAFRSL